MGDLFLGLRDKYNDGFKVVDKDKKNPSALAEGYIMLSFYR